MRNFFNQFQYRVAHFMSGRYGGRDALNFSLLGAAIVLDILFMIFRIPALTFISLVPFGFSIFRTFSRNTAKRYEENRKYVNFFKNLLARRTHHIYRCPNPDCKQKIRVPRKGGKTVEITCPKCGERFRKKI